MVKIKKNTVFTIYRPYWIRHISLQHEWVDWYYGSQCSPVCVIRLTAVSGFWQLLPIAHNSWLKLKKHHFCHLSAILIHHTSLQHD